MKRVIPKAYEKIDEKKDFSTILISTSTFLGGIGTCICVWQFSFILFDNWSDIFHFSMTEVIKSQLKNISL